MRTAGELMACRDVLVAPYLTAWCGGPDTDAIPAHGRLRRGAALETLDDFPAELREGSSETLSGEWLYGGPYYKHFGHVMTDSIPRLWAFDPQRHRGVVFANYRKNASPAPAHFFREILSAFGVHKHKIRVVDAPTRVETLWFAEPGSVTGLGPAPWYWPHVAKVEAVLLSRANPELPTPERLFFGRTHIHQQGSFMGETWFADLLSAQGYAFIKPETYSVPDQVKLLRSARLAVYTEGSAAHLTELMTPFDAPVGMLLRRLGGEAIFEPHLTPRTVFNPVGQDSTLRRLRIATRRGGPSFPSYHIRPERTYADLVRFGFVDDVGFDLDDYRAAERADCFAYFTVNPHFARAHLAEVEALRAQLAS